MEGGRPQQVYRSASHCCQHYNLNRGQEQTHSHSWPTLHQKFRMLTGPGEGNLVTAAKPNQPTGDPLTGFSLLCVQTVFLSFLVLEWE